MLACFFAVMSESPQGSQVYILANDEGQALDDLSLLKKLIAANRALKSFLRIKRNVIERTDGGGFITVLPAQDVTGAHGKTFRLCAFDEIHAYRDWGLLEAMQFDPTRLDAQMWITSYASMFHRPGVPLYDMFRVGKAGTDPRMLFDWWAADYCTASDIEHLTPEERANPSRQSWADEHYLEQQAHRLPAHKYRRLHLNLPGLPEGSAFQPGPVMDAIARGVTLRPPEVGVDHEAFGDMSGGSSDDAVIAIGHEDAEGRAVVDVLLDQGQHPPFDPNKAVERFVRKLREYRISRITGDRYAGLTFRAQFENAGITYAVASRTTSQLYEALEPLLNSQAVVLPDVPRLEQPLLGLVWKGGKITHQNGEHDDYATATAGLVTALQARRSAMAPELISLCLGAGDGQRMMPPEW